MPKSSIATTGKSWRASLIGLGAGALALIAAASFAQALEEPPGEAADLKACEKRACTMILEKNPVGDDLKCDVQKTWAKSTLEGGESKGVSWGFGDARCKANLKLERADIIGALTKPKHTIRIPAQQVNCVIEREGEIKPLTIKLAPKLTFKNGKADKVWINLESIDGPADVKSTIWTAAKLEDTIGIFHRPMLKSIDKFVHKQCAKRYGPGAKVEAENKKGGKDGKTKVASPAVKPPVAKAATEKSDVKSQPAKDIPKTVAKDAAPAAGPAPPSKATAAP
jgi:hypothetical protein